LIDGKPSAACSTFAFQLDERSVETIEGLSGKGTLHAIQQAFLEANAFQCGFCTAGFVLLVKALLDSDSQPSDQKIGEWLKANVCRCTGYRSILAATQLAAARMREK
jgi:carbon-monoxide dehydrogenase small subunit